MLQHSSLVDWCNLTARPVLEAAAFGQPVSFSAKQAIRRLDVLLSGDMSAADRGEGIDATQWCRLCRALDEHPEAYGSFVVALSHGSGALKKLVDALAPRTS
ncbi:hypothetical protein [Dyella ginsengisoli]|uniref:hypothetical protein n=1 Tax=Dyella ginsengisoli TaxID=363848 RepID=UPI000344B5A7|nr:hypothetical protein [Dyella ginsengisoli]